MLLQILFILIQILFIVIHILFILIQIVFTLVQILFNSIQILFSLIHILFILIRILCVIFLRVLCVSCFCFYSWTCSLFLMLFFGLVVWPIVRVFVYVCSCHPFCSLPCVLNPCSLFFVLDLGLCFSWSSMFFPFCLQFFRFAFVACGCLFLRAR